VKTFVPLVALVLTAGCVSLVPPASKLPPRYTLTPERVGEQGPEIDATLAIADARAEGAYNTSKIAVLTGANEIRYLAEGEWSDRAPRIFSLLLERSIEERDRLLAVSDRVALPLADYVLYADMQNFNIDRTREPAVADVTYRVRLEGRRGRTLGARSFSAEKVVAGRKTQEAASAINEAAAQATSETAAWALDLIEQAETPDGA